MVRLEYEGVEISIPENWDDITLGRYESLKFDTLGTARQRVELAAAICGVNAELFLNWPTEVFNRIVDYIGFMFENIQANPCPTVEIDGVNYAVSVEDKLTLAEWVDIEEVQKTGEAVMSTILAIVCRPVGEVYNPDNTANRQAMFAALPVGQILGVFAFFLTYKNAYDRRTAAFSNLVRLYDLLPRNTKLLRSLGGGIRLSQIWRAIRYYALMKLSYVRLQKCLNSFSTSKTKMRRMQHRIN